MCIRFVVANLQVLMQHNGTGNQDNRQATALSWMTTCDEKLSATLSKSIGLNEEVSANHLIVHAFSITFLLMISSI